ncbi:MAG: glycosyl hydrolase family 28-related protein [Planctomycetota bacterium]
MCDQSDVRINAKAFGATGDGSTDDTAAIQQALDKAAETNGTVFFPDGTYCCADLQVPPHTGLVGNPTWGYRGTVDYKGELSGGVLKLNSEKAKCLLNLTGAVGATVQGLSLTGENLGEGIDGIYLGNEGRSEEDSPRIDTCRVVRFSGHGLHFERPWCFSLRHSMIAFNKGDGLCLGGWDGFILDNWFSGNGGAGIGVRYYSSAYTITGNRIEWNRDGGIRLHGGSHYNITGNYVDRAGTGGIVLMPLGEDRLPSYCMSVVGNVVNRSGKPEYIKAVGGEDDPLNSCQIRIEGAHGITCTGNTMCIGQDDGGGQNSPDYGMVLKDLKNCIVKDNVMHIGALKELVRDEGGHGEGVIIKDNVGSLFVETEPGITIWDSGQI